MKGKPGTLYMTVSISLVIDSGLSMGVWETEFPLPASKISLTKREWADVAGWSPQIMQVLIDSGVAEPPKTP